MGTYYGVLESNYDQSQLVSFVIMKVKIMKCFLLIVPQFIIISKISKTLTATENFCHSLTITIVQCGV